MRRREEQAMEPTAQVETFVRDLRRRNRREIIVGILLLPLFGLIAAKAPAGSVLFYGYCLIILAILFVIGMTWFVAAPRGDLISHPATHIEHWSTEMLRQVKLLRWVPLWYVGPFVPGFALLLWSEEQDHGGSSGILLAVVILVFGLVTWLNLRAASKLALEARSLKEAAANQGRPAT